jgi:ribosome biogenesis ATPase
VITWIKKHLEALKDPNPDIKEKENVDKKEQLIEINQQDFEAAIKRVQPSSKREGFATVPDVSWDDIGALQNVRDELKTAILVRESMPLKSN